MKGLTSRSIVPPFVGKIIPYYAGRKVELVSYFNTMDQSPREGAMIYAKIRGVYENNLKIELPDGKELLLFFHKKSKLWCDHDGGEKSDRKYFDVRVRAATQEETNAEILAQVLNDGEPTLDDEEPTRVFIDPSTLLRNSAQMISQEFEALILLLKQEIVAAYHEIDLDNGSAARNARFANFLTKLLTVQYQLSQQRTNESADRRKNVHDIIRHHLHDQVDLLSALSIIEILAKKS